MPARRLPSTPVSDLIIDILDVGHGSCVVIRTGDSVTLIDTGPGAPILEYLRTEGINALDTVIISHADSDHLGGLAALLGQQVPIKRILWNGDSAKQSAIWHDLVYELDALNRAGLTTADEEARENMLVATADPAVGIDILAPRLQLRRLGANGIDKDGDAIGTNTVSVVARLVVDGEPLLLVPGDLDAVGYKHLKDARGSAITAKYLLLPHHGGLMGTPTETQALVEELVRAVQPEAVFVSNGRGRYDNPRGDVLGAVRAAAPTVPIACTELAVGCSKDPQARVAAGVPFAAGWHRGSACAASTRLTRHSGISTPLDRAAHIDFIRDYVSDPQCLA